jgi:hypothetical protein
MAIDDYWYKNAVIYCLNVATYMDCNGGVTWVRPSCGAW